MTLGDIIEHHARFCADQPALHFEGEVLTYARLAERARKLVNALAAAGITRQDRIAILSRNTPEYLEAYCAAGLGGFMALGLNYRLSEPEQTGILQDAEPGVLFFEDGFTARADALRAHLAPDTRYVRVRGEGPCPPWAVDYEAFIAPHDGREAALRATEEDTLFLIYTSGTTGRPKGAMLGNGGQVEQMRAQAISHAALPTDRMLVVMPFYHIGGPTELLTYLYVGAAIVLHREFDADAILASIHAHRVTAAHFAPTMIQMLLDRVEHTAADLSSLHTIVYASAPMSVALYRRARAAFGPVFMQVYGMTEHGLGSTLLKHQHVVDGDETQVRRLASAGQPYPDTRMRVARADGSDCAAGEPGELWMRSKALMQGYWRNPEATADALVDGWLRTGDVGYFDADGFLYIVDRKKDMIVSGGENIYSREVEEALTAHPAVREAAVIGVPDPRWGESVAAFVVTEQGREVSEAELIEHCRNLIASYKKPRMVAFMQELPRVASTRKVDKQALRAPYWAGKTRNI